MLVLSRRAQQQIVFPNLGVTVEILQLKGKLVKIGITAPRSVSILRPEASGTNHSPDGGGPAARAMAEAEHRLRNELNLLQLRLEMLQRRLDAGEELEAESTLSGLMAGVDSLDLELASAPRDLLHAGRRRLMVVEDCDNERKLMAYALAGHGFEVQVARDGAEAVEILSRSARIPDAVLMDLEMPMANGLEVLNFIRHDQRLQDMIVFAVPGTERNPESEPVGRGWDGWFTKPLDMRELVQQLTRTLTGPQAPVCPSGK